MSDEQMKSSAQSLQDRIQEAETALQSAETMLRRFAAMDVPEDPIQRRTLEANLRGTATTVLDLRDELKTLRSQAEGMSNR